MADLKYTVQVDAQSGINSLRQLQNQVQDTNAVFGRLSAAIGGIAIGAALRGLGQFANSINDLSAATNISTQSILGFSQAVQRNGGNMNLAQEAIGRFTRSVGQATEGNKGVIASFEKLGISLSDIQNLSEQDALALVVQRLGEVESTAARAAISQDLFGRSVGRIDFRGVAGDIVRLTASQAENARAVETAGRVNQQLTNSWNDFRLALLNALKPLADLLEKITSNEKLMRDFIEAVINIGTAFAVFKTVSGAATAVAALGAAAATSAGQVDDLADSLDKKGQKADRGGSAISRLASRLFGFVVAAEAANFSLKQLFDFDLSRFADDTLQGFIDKSLDLLELPQDNTAWTDLLGDIETRIKFINETGLNGLADDLKDLIRLDQERLTVQRNQVELEEKNLTQFREELALQTQLRQQAQETIRTYEDTFDSFKRRFELQTEMINLSDDERIALEVMADFRESHLRQVAVLEDRINAIVLDGSREQLALMTSLIEARNTLIDISERNLPVLEDLIESRQRALTIQRESVAAERAAAEAAARTRREAEELVRARERAAADAAARTRRAAEELVRAREGALSTVREFGVATGDRLREQQQQAELAGLSGIRRTLREIEIQENRVATAARRRVEEQLGDNDPAALKSALQEIDQISQEIINRRSDVAQAIYEEQRTFSSGWQRAFAEYSDAATNASLQAERIFQKTTQGMEDAIVNFARTGKFEWRSFTASILEELLRSNIRQLISQTFGGIGRIGSSTNSNFAGFFASGGLIPSGKFGVVGERGPELVSGPAQVTPMSGVGTTQVVYNINAVDAPSFQQLLARDPTLLYAISEQGRRSLPQTRR
jgi:lambda family phage tail tape measure protein